MPTRPTYYERRGVPLPIDLPQESLPRPHFSKPPPPRTGRCKPLFAEQVPGSQMKLSCRGRGGAPSPDLFHQKLGPAFRFLFIMPHIPVFRTVSHRAGVFPIDLCRDSLLLFAAPRPYDAAPISWHGFPKPPASPGFAGAKVFPVNLCSSGILSDATIPQHPGPKPNAAS